MLVLKEWESGFHFCLGVFVALESIVYGEFPSERSIGRICIVEGSRRGSALRYIALHSPQHFPID